ncbi:MAG: hypothetical protein WCR20_10215 [Verrucomicrobiota bacterium]
MKEKNKFYVVCAYAAGMAWVESAVVFYLRTMINRINPYQPLPLPEAGGLGMAEVVREAATLLMLLTVGILAGRTWRERLGYAALAFGLWDILYYVFLVVMCSWPTSILDWDILFLIPLPWWGPVLAPVLIASLMIIWGTLVTQEESCARFDMGWNGLELAGSGGNTGVLRDFGEEGRFDTTLGLKGPVLVTLTRLGGG